MFLVIWRATHTFTKRSFCVACPQEMWSLHWQAGSQMWAFHCLSTYQLPSLISISLALRSLGPHSTGTLQVFSSVDYNARPSFLPAVKLLMVVSGRLPVMSARVPLQSSLALHLGLVTFLLVETRIADGSDLNEDGLISAPGSRRNGPRSRRKYGSVPWLPRMCLDLHESQWTSKQRAWAWNGYHSPEMGDTIALKTSPPVNYFLQPDATLQRLRSLFW